LVDLGDQTLVFDVFENPAAAQDLLEASIQLTGRRPSLVIVSHKHPDHWGGLQVFEGSTVLATQATRQAMIPFIEKILATKQDPSSIENELQETEARLAAEIDPQKRQIMQLVISRRRHTLQALPRLEPRLPDLTFEGKLVFHGSRRLAELIDTGKGHTESDSLLSLPQDGLVFIGDIGFFQAHAFMSDCYPAEWVARLEELAGWEVETYVPGHGPVGDKADLLLVAAYIRTLEDLVRGVVEGGGSLEDALALTLPAPFDGWYTTSRRFEPNVRSIFKRQIL
jgi:glyoxylase-like metal-dependent hydrolase (beta-lactamase superfamily II)